MNSPIYAAPASIKFPEPVPPQVSAAETNDLLRQLIDVQREQLAFARQQAAAMDSSVRWRAFLARWAEEYPTVGQDCKQILPIMERVYLRLISELVNRLHGENSDDMESEFVLAEFLDKYGLRLSQIGTIIGQLSPLADAAPPAVPPPPTTEGPS